MKTKTKRPDKGEGGKGVVSLVSEQGPRIGWVSSNRYKAIASKKNSEDRHRVSNYGLKKEKKKKRKKKKIKKKNKKKQRTTQKKKNPKKKNPTPNHNKEKNRIRKKKKKNKNP